MMKQFALGACLTVVLTASIAAAAVTFTVYPGSKPYHQAKLTPEELQMQKYAASKGITEDSWTTPDAFTKVAGFYSKLYKPVNFPTQPGLKMQFFTLDGSASIATAKWYMKVQRPLMAGFTSQGGHPHNTIIQDITLIEYIHPK